MKYFHVLCLLLVVITGHSQNRVLVDGNFDEWNDYPIIYADAIGDNGFLGLDFKELKVFNDNEFIFFSLEVGQEINLQDLNEISIFLDTDNNPNTGFITNGVGAELVYSFGNRSGNFYESGNVFTLNHSDIGLVSAPTVTAERFEIAINRNAIISGSPIFPSNQIKILFRDNAANGDFLPDSNEEIIYTFSDDELEPLPEFSIEAPDGSDFRVLSYNVLNDGIFDPARIASFTRIFQAIQPDIIGFQEISDFSSSQVANRIESILPSSTGQEWYHAKEGPDCHAISRYPIIQSELIEGSNESAGNGAFLIDIPENETDLLFIVAHPPCCGNNEGRQIEVDLIMAFLREALEGNGPIPLAANTPIIIVGDMNLVGDNQQLTTLITGDIVNEFFYGPDFNPDWDGNSLLDSKPFTTGLPFNYTWFREGSSFSAGRLDYIIYSGSNLSLENNFSLFTPSLSPDILNDYNLSANDVLISSDHLPIVADFQLKNLTSQTNFLSSNKFEILNIYPNASSDKITVSFQMHQPDFVTIQLIDQLGKRTTLLPSRNFSAGTHEFQFDLSDFPAGMYLLQVENGEFIDAKKVIIN